MGNTIIALLIGQAMGMAAASMCAVAKRGGGAMRDMDQGQGIQKREGGGKE